MAYLNAIIALTDISYTRIAVITTVEEEDLQEALWSYTHQD